MATHKRIESSAVTDDFWQRVERLIPVRDRPGTQTYLRKPGAGRPPKPARLVFEAIVYVLRTGCPWKALPKERFGSASAVHQRFLEWERAGLFEALWAAGLAEHEQMEGIAWRWERIDGAISNAPQAAASASTNPTHRGTERVQGSVAQARAWRPVVTRRPSRHLISPDGAAGQLY
jgi:transposase